MAWTPFTRRHHDRSRMRYASDLTDRGWSLIERFMPKQPRLAAGARLRFGRYPGHAPESRGPLGGNSRP